MATQRALSTVFIACIALIFGGAATAQAADTLPSWTEKVYGIPPEQVIGSSIKTELEMREGKPVLVRLPELNFFDDKEGKPVAINQHIGRRPIAAFGNSDGDLQMLQWTTAGEGLRFTLYVHHTDGEREWAYDRESSIGRLDKGLRRSKGERLDGGGYEAGLKGRLPERYDQLGQRVAWFCEAVTNHLVCWFNTNC